MFLVYVNKDHGIYKRTNQVTRNENLEKATRGFVYNNLCYSYTYMANWNFEAFCWDISASIRLFNYYYKNKLITLIFMFIKFKKSKIKNCHFISSVIQKSKASLNRFWKTYRAHILCEEITLKSRAKSWIVNAILPLFEDTTSNKVKQKLFFSLSFWVVNGFMISDAD